MVIGRTKTTQSSSIGHLANLAGSALGFVAQRAVVGGAWQSFIAVIYSPVAIVIA
jgi:hypothetical protein